MPEFVSDFFTWLAAVPPLYAYIAILVIAWGENVIPPIPGDLVIVFAGYLVGLGRLDFATVIVLATIGGALGFMNMYAVGRRVGGAVLDPHRYRWLPKGYIHKTREWLQRYGLGVVAANRFLSGARSVISLTVGMAHTPIWKTAGLATLSAAVWTSLMVWAGFVVGHNWQKVGEYLKTYGKFVAVVTVVVLVIVFLRRMRARQLQRRRQRRAGS